MRTRQIFQRLERTEFYFNESELLDSLKTTIQKLFAFQYPVDWTIDIDYGDDGFREIKVCALVLKTEEGSLEKDSSNN